MKLILFASLLLCALNSRADYLDQVDIYVNGTKIWNTNTLSDGKDFSTDSLRAGDTLLFHAYADWNDLLLARLLIHNMNGQKVKEFGRKNTRVYGAQFEWILSEKDFLQEFKISLDYNIKDHSDWWFGTLSNDYLVRKNLLKQNLYDASNVWDSIRVKADWFEKDARTGTTSQEIPQEFAQFYHTFITDSVFQRGHIAFDELIGVMGACENTIRYNTENWEYTDWDFTQFFDEDNHTENIDGWKNYLFFTTNRFYYEFRLKEHGIIYRSGFEKINGTWQLTLYYINAC